MHIELMARHALFPRSQTEKKRSRPSHRPPRDVRQQAELLRERFAQSSEVGPRFLEGLPACPNSRPHCFSANFGTRTYRCFECDSQSNQLDLWAAAHQIMRHQNAEDLCRRFGIELPLNPSRTQLKKSSSSNQQICNHW